MRATRIVAGGITTAGCMLGMAQPAHAMIPDRLEMFRDPVPAQTVVVTTPPAAPKPTTFVVQLGDTLSALGLKFNRTWEALAGWNHIPNPNLIFVGQAFQVPPAGWQTPVMPAEQVVPVQAPAPKPQPVQAVVSAPTSSFQSCVMFRESTDGAGSSNLYGILPSTWAANGFSGSPYTASRAQQDAAFQTIYARDGTAPWAPYDGC